jgi:hypothetical protein
MPKLQLKEFRHDDTLETKAATTKRGKDRLVPENLRHGYD